MFFLTGVARYLFVPLAEAVVFAMLASYVLSRTLVPTLAMLLMGHAHKPKAGAKPNLFMRIYHRFDRGFERMRAGYIVILSSVLVRRGAVRQSCSSASACVSMGLVFVLGEDFFPSVDAGDIRLHMRAPTGTRIEETARLADEVEKVIREVVPPEELGTILDNLGLPYSGINLSYSNAGTIGTLDGEIQVALNEDHKPTQNLHGQAARDLPQRFPGIEFFFQPADIVTQILNFGLPAAVDVQISGANQQGNFDVARKLLKQVRMIPGTVDTHIQQKLDEPAHQSADGSHAPAAAQSHREQRGAERADFAVGQLADVAGFLVQQQERRGIQRRGADAAVPGFVDRRTVAHAGFGRRQRPDATARQPGAGLAAEASSRKSRTTTSSR